MNKIKREDEVVILAGKDKGKQGKVMRFKGDRIFVSGINMVKKHSKPVPALNKPGGIVEQESSLHISNVAMYNPTAKKHDKVGFSIEEKDGRKVKFRIFKSDGKRIDS